ncbi:MAG: helix-turn-helix domain-containing protein [Kiritimatiellales bacterium]
MNKRIVLFPNSGIRPPFTTALPRKQGLPVFPLAAGWQRERGWEKRIDWDNSVRTVPDSPDQDVLLFQYTLSGGALFSDGQIEILLTPGTGFLVPFGSKTSYRLPRDMEWEWIWVTAQGHDLHRWGQAFVEEHGYCFELPSDRGAVAVLSALLADRMAQREMNAERVSLRVYQFFMELPMTLRLPRLSGIDQAAVQIENCFADPNLNVSVLAEAAGMTRSHFTRLFHAETGQSPGRAIEEYRLRHARELLMLSELSVKEVCFACGYRSVSHFCAQFKKRFDSTPGRFRGR